ncbi:hypothetical protein AK812_SmicGene8694 [Symbiodinium microadriaticum]|uniref:Uncharacterized protein n=1 Tax=Symbiodinium microadriaticum TaxID=2951 RepID=A0A1Q9EKF9_SYMMI|nr:hypothetical protein AK812_SmicGene8694 [Symbiodinium microadriaticum]
MKEAKPELLGPGAPSCIPDVQLDQVFYTTPLGFNKSEAILDVFFAYLGALRAQGVDMDLYKSLQDMVKLQWNWKQEADPYGTTVSDLAEVMTRLPRDKLLSGDSLIEQPDGASADAVLLLWPSNMNLARVSPSGLGEAPLKEVGSKIRTLQYYDARA